LLLCGDLNASAVWHGAFSSIHRCLAISDGS
jgi:hypothetical protein